MEEIREMIGIYNDYLYMILFGVGAAIIITFILAQFTRRIRFVKYLPGLISLLLGIVLLIRVLPVAYIKTNLGSLALSVIATGSGLVGLSIAIILDLLNIRKQNFQAGEEKYEEY